MAGNVVMLISFIFIGPAPFFGDSLPNSAGLSYVVAVTMGFGFGFVMVSTFTRAYREAMSQGYSDDINTYLVLSGKIVICQYFDQI
jgi:biotin transporter BioY